MIEKPALKAENPVINKSIQFPESSTYFYFFSFEAPPPIFFIQKGSKNFLNDFLCSTHFLIAVPLSLD